MTAGWSGTSLQASDVADRAWGRVGVRRWDLWDAGEHVLLGPIASAFAPELDRLTRLVLDECEVRLYGEARERVVRTAQRVMVYDVVQAVRTGIIRELERPDPVPFTPPRSAPGSEAGASDPGPSGAGYGMRSPVISGPGAATWRSEGPSGAACFGVDLRGSDGEATAAIAETAPVVDVCRRCLPMRARLQPVPA